MGSETAVKRPWLELVATVHAFDDFAAHLNDAARNHIDAVHPSLKGGSNAGSDGSRAEGAVTDEDDLIPEIGAEMDPEEERVAEMFGDFDVEEAEATAEDDLPESKRARTGSIGVVIDPRFRDRRESHGLMRETRRIDRWAA